ncbi:hypothetical protein FRC14_006870 [Serendipita sp. 396]|nr:hypothetical protein FRC14_006870 [Serendipita sp. 396]KAG8787805.1 hypothetical protein FRC15_007745 [Serendipita sp. 397]KAG8835379.1 hypothetical protein FRC18_000634 [Serendipita sp. 400]KAG8873548.1 hypothetical protein FRC20_007828 [Serendipita sp. 405]KAG9056158.1 hypothetical protein FS842_011499 [Serendipita sp. 407]
MEDLRRDHKNELGTAETGSQQENNMASGVGVSHDGTLSLWTFGVASIATVMSIPLLFFPRVLVFLSETGMDLSPLEKFISNQLGILLLVLAAGTMTSAPDGTSTASDNLSTESHPLLAPVSVGASLSAIVAWNSKGVGSLGTFLCFGNGIIGAWGFWAMLFAGSSRVSKKTGADKRTSAFIFGNRTAASSQKKAWKTRQKVQ